jgi:hypothetical protein
LADSSPIESTASSLDASVAFFVDHPVAAFLAGAGGLVALRYLKKRRFQNLSQMFGKDFQDYIVVRDYERCVLARSIIDENGKVIRIKYKGCPFYNDVKYTVEMNHFLTWMHGPGSCGKTVFVKALLQDLKGKGHYTVYATCYAEDFKDLVDLVAPQLHVDVPAPEAKSNSTELFIMLLKAQSALGKRVYVVIDDAELLSHDTPGLSFLLRCCSKFDMGLLFSSSRSYPDFLKSTVYASRITTLRFDPGLEPFKVALAEAGLSGADVEAVLEATGPHVGDVVRVMGEYRRSMDVKGAIDTCVDAAYKTIKRAVVNVVVDAVSGGDLTINDACDILALAVVDSDKTVNLFVRFNDDPAKLKRMIAVGEYMVKVGVLSHGNLCGEFVWDSNMLAIAYKMNREKLERMRGRVKGDVAGGDKPTA